MNDNRGLQRQTFLIASLTVFISSLAGISAEQIKKPAAPEVPIYESEEIAAPRLEKLVREKAKDAGIQIDALLPRAPEDGGKYIGIPLEGRVSGTAEQVIKFLSAIESRDQYRLMPRVVIYGDRKDPRLAKASFMATSWYAKTEKASRQTKKWRKAAKPAAPALEIFAACAATLDENAFSAEILPLARDADKPPPKKPQAQVRLTGFAFEGTEVLVSGEGRNSAATHKFGGRLFKDESLNAYDWSWQTRPKYNTKRKDGTVEFSIRGELNPKTSKKKE